MSGGILINHKYRKEITPLCLRMPSLYPLGWKYYFMKTTYLTNRTFLKLTNAGVSNNIDISIDIP